MGSTNILLNPINAWENVVMSFDGEERTWTCSSRAVNLRRVRSIVRDIRKPCLQHSPIKARKMLKPERWHATFDSDGKIIGFNKVLKLIVLGGVDPSIRAEVWEFLLGCYAIGSTAEYRWQLRMARRERYKDLIKQCQMMHSSIGTGTLAYAVGSKVMDVRIVSKDKNRTISSVNTQASKDAANETERHSKLNNVCAEVSCASQVGVLSDSADPVSVEGSTDHEAYDSSNDYFSSRPERLYEPDYTADSYFDFPPLPVTNLFEKSDRDEEVREVQENTVVTQQRNNEPMHSFQINNNVDLIMEDAPTIDVHARVRNYDNSDTATQGKMTQPKSLEQKRISLNRTGIQNGQEMTTIDVHDGMIANEGRVADWLWTLHRIVVDVVRTDSHLEFYGDAKNVARMSDILAVYAWVDPDTGYCQGMSDLLSPFVVLYEDNADAFWCFEMLLRRMRQNFQMEGPTGVMRQLEAVGRILELTDIEIFTHLSVIGAESLLFAFRMLLVLFRRELSFNEALCMWEMMWAADFDEAMSRELEGSCLEPLVLHLPTDAITERRLENKENSKQNSKGSQMDQANVGKPVSGDDGIKSASMIPFCGLRASNFWTRNYSWRIGTLTLSPIRNVDDELAVFCVAAILIVNRPQIIKRTHSMDDIIKMFNDTNLEINVKRCIRMAIRLRKKYFYKLIKQSNNGNIER